VSPEMERVVETLFSSVADLRRVLRCCMGNIAEGVLTGVWNNPSRTKITLPLNRGDKVKIKITRHKHRLSLSPSAVVRP